MKLKIEVGRRIGKLVCQGEGERLRLPSGQYNRSVIVKCDCGTVKTIRLLHWSRERIKSCGCAMPEEHGDKGTRLYNSWRAMKNRCTYSYQERRYYYDKGISVCEEWKEYKNFKKWSLDNGYEESLTIDRIDGNKGYSPDNCRWVSQRINNLNRVNSAIVKHEDRTVPLMLLLEEIGAPASYSLVLSRLYRGWDLQKAISQAPRPLRH